MEELFSIQFLVMNVDILVWRKSLRNVGDLFVVVGKLLKSFLHSVIEEGLPLLEPEQIPRRMTSCDVNVSGDEIEDVKVCWLFSCIREDCCVWFRTSIISP